MILPTVRFDCLFCFAFFPLGICCLTLIYYEIFNVFFRSTWTTTKRWPIILGSCHFYSGYEIAVLFTASNQLGLNKWIFAQFLTWQIMWWLHNFSFRMLVAIFRNRSLRYKFYSDFVRVFFFFFSVFKYLSFSQLKLLFKRYQFKFPIIQALQTFSF